jgi:bifunctional DNA-binding transcriptional regulator/antitoxin component of YhaV-PrlF toxin-antitoxin module
MPKREISILHANAKSVILEGTVGIDYRISIPKQLRRLIKPQSSVKITIEILDANGQSKGATD